MTTSRTTVTAVEELCGSGAAVTDAEGLTETVAATGPELCILDVRLPPTYTDEGIRAALDLRAADPQLPVLVLSQYVEERYASELITSHGAALGYLLKDRILDVDDFLESLQRVARGGSALDPVVVATLLQPRLPQTTPRPTDALSERERTVLSLMAQGYSNAAIARELWLTERTVESHVSAVFSRLGLVASRDENRRVLAVIAHLADQERGG